MTGSPDPVLFSFRRCPYAIRARLALAVSCMRCELREVKLRDKPPAMLAVSPKGTVPVLVLPDGNVIEESLDIMRWALGNRDPEGWLARDDAELIGRNDSVFKQDLDGYKYSERHSDEALAHRERGLAFLRELDARLTASGQLCGAARGLADAAVMPFVRQFAAVDHEWFDAQPLPRLHTWLKDHLGSDLFAAVMMRVAPWSPGDPPVFFPPPEDLSNDTPGISPARIRTAPRVCGPQKDVTMTVSAWHYYDGETELIGELHSPENPNGKAILVAHEADGIGGNVRRRCAMLAAVGYTAAAADLHGAGRVLPDGEIGPALENFRRNPAILRQRVRAALDALCVAAEVTPDRAAAIGYCFGGMAVLELARSGSPVAGVASFHGLLTSQAPASPGTITARVLACTGALDPLVPPSDIAAFQAEMSAAGADWHLLIHGRALHSYTNDAVDDLDDPRMRYDGPADRQSWSALMTFLSETLHCAG